MTLGLQFCLSMGDIDMRWHVGGGGGDNPRVTWSYLSGGTMEWIKGGKTSDKGFGLTMIRNRVELWNSVLGSAFCWVKVVVLSAQTGRWPQRTT